MIEIYLNKMWACVLSMVLKAEKSYYAVYRMEVRLRFSVVQGNLVK